MINEEGTNEGSAERSGMMIMIILKTKSMSTMKILMRTMKSRMMTRLTPNCTLNQFNYLHIVFMWTLSFYACRLCHSMHVDFVE